jgi:D-alanyl-D-alanine carboxypeptidase
MLPAKTLFVAGAFTAAALASPPAAGHPGMPRTAVVGHSATHVPERPHRAKPRVLQRIVTQLVRNGAPGALAVVRTPTGVHRAASGFAELEPRIAMQAVDRFRIASVTKTFVAAVVLELAAEGRLTLDDSVERWLPGLVPEGRSITLRELLNHTSGLYNYVDDPAFVAARIADPGRVWSPRELVAVATSHPPNFPPGTGWSYSNTNYVLLGLVVERVTGRTLADELRTRIFQPLALASTSFPTGTEIDAPYAHAYLVSRPPLPFPAGTLIDISTIVSPSAWGAGQIVSTADDVTRFFGALLGGRLLPRHELAAMKTQVVPYVMPYGYGLGLRVTYTRCGQAYGHDGDFVAYRNIVWATANGRRVASIMVNIDETRLSWDRLEAAAEAALCSG